MIERDLFHEDGGGYWRDVALLDRLVAEKLEAEADAVRAEGWKWVEVASDFPYGHTFGLRRLFPATEPLNQTEQAERDALQAEYDAREAEYESAAELPEEVDARLAEIEAALARLDERPLLFEPHEVARAGAFVSLDFAGTLKVERGFVRPGDEAQVASNPRQADEASGPDVDGTGVEQPFRGTATPADETNAGSGRDVDADDEEYGARVSDRLVTELTAQRTLSLRAALAKDPEAAYLAVLHALALRTFYGAYSVDSCLEIDARSAPLGSHAPGLNDTPAAQELTKLHDQWSRQMPSQSARLWAFVVDLDTDSRAALFAYCTSRSVNAVALSYDRRPAAMAHADYLAEHVGLDMAGEGWAPTVENYLGRVTKAQILAAVREAKGAEAGELVAHLKKADMAQEAERLLQGTGWLPQALRIPGLESPRLPFDAEDVQTRDAELASGFDETELPVFPEQPEAEPNRGYPVAAE